jgi:hypothetical protein
MEGEGERATVWNRTVRAIAAVPESVGGRHKHRTSYCRSRSCVVGILGRRSSCARPACALLGGVVGYSSAPCCRESPSPAEVVSAGGPKDADVALDWERRKPGLLTSCRRR